MLMPLWLGLNLLYSCKKDWLDEKPRASIVVPVSLADLQAILDNSALMNGTQGGSTPNAGEMSADNYYMTYNDFLTRTEIEQNTYIWQKEIYAGSTSFDWNKSYQQIYNSNIVLEGLQKLSNSDRLTSTYNTVKGSALFYRAYAFFNLAQIYCSPYNPATTNTGYGLPLRLTSDPNEILTRSTLLQTYDRIIDDLTQATELLPEIVPYKTRPGKAAAFAALARVYLSMSNFENALVYSGKALAISNFLLDFNTLTLTAAYPVARFNNEVVFNSVLNGSLIWNTYGRVDNQLFQSYASNDLRQSAYFRTNTDGTKAFKGSYYGSQLLFSGLSNGELYLTSAECKARKGLYVEALADLNKLLVKRWKNGTFVPITASNSNDALIIILNERRKELVFRGLRWTDLRRLNQDPNFQTTLVRILGTQQYSLVPNDPRYVLPIPDDVIAANPSLPQNIR